MRHLSAPSVRKFINFNKSDYIIKTFSHTTFKIANDNDKEIGKPARRPNSLSVHNHVRLHSDDLAIGVDKTASSLIKGEFSFAHLSGVWRPTCRIR